MNIDKKINYEDQRLTEKQKKKIKPANQGGGPNYLGKQETVTVPKKWLSDPDHVVAELAYITPKEKKILLEKNLYGSLKGKPNRGPGGVQSLQGDLGGYDASPGGPDSESGDGSGGRNDKARAADIMTGRVSVTSPSGMQTEGYRGYGPNQRQYDGIGDFYGNPTIGQRIGNFMNPRSILSGILGLINPALGLATRGLGYLGDKFQGLRGYNPDGTPRTQEEYELAMKDKQIQGRIDNIMNRQTLGKSFSQTNLDSLLGMTDMYGDRFSPSTAQNVLTGRDLKGFTPSRMGIMNPNLITPTNLNDYLGYRDREYIENVPSANPQDYDLFSNAMAEVTQKDIDASKTRGFNMMDYGTAVDLGMISPNVTEYEFEELKQGNITSPGSYQA